MKNVSHFPINGTEKGNTACEILQQFIAWNFANREAFGTS
jgi:hypothetical protein